jgi:hypothetical protein
MPRTPDGTIPVDEALFRSVSIDDVKGEDVLPQAVDLPRCSFNRSAYSTPEDVVTPKRPRDNGVVAVTAAELPEPVPRETAEPNVFFVADDPNPPEEPANDAHCEVRMRRGIENSARTTSPTSRFWRKLGTPSGQDSCRFDSDLNHGAKTGYMLRAQDIAA